MQDISPDLKLFLRNTAIVRWTMAVFTCAIGISFTVLFGLYGNLYWLGVVMGAALTIANCWPFFKVKSMIISTHEAYAELLQKELDETKILTHSLLKSKFETLGHIIESYFEGTPITRHIIKMELDALPIVLIGDDDKMVEVSLEVLAKEGVEIALQQARERWNNE